MEALRAWLLRMAASALTAGILLLIVPKGHTEKTVKLVTGLFLMLAVAAPLSGLLPNLQMRGISSMNLTEITGNDWTVQTMLRSLRPQIDAIASDFDLAVTSVEADYYYDENQCLNIQSLHIIVTGSGAQPAQFADRVAEALGLPVTANL